MSVLQRFRQGAKNRVQKVKNKRMGVDVRITAKPKTVGQILDMLVEIEIIDIKKNKAIPFAPVQILVDNKIIKNRIAGRSGRLIETIRFTEPGFHTIDAIFAGRITMIFGDVSRSTFVFNVNKGFVRAENIDTGGIVNIKFIVQTEENRFSLPTNVHVLFPVPSISVSYSIEFLEIIEEQNLGLFDEENKITNLIADVFEIVKKYMPFVSLQLLSETCPIEIRGGKLSRLRKVDARTWKALKTTEITLEVKGIPEVFSPDQIFSDGIIVNGKEFL